MLDLETAKTAAAEADGAVAALEARAAEIDQALAVANGEHQEASAATARAIADGTDTRGRSALITAEQKAAAVVGALNAGRDEVAARLVHARRRQTEARQALNEAEDRHAYAVSAAALDKFTREFTEALGDMITNVDRRHVGDIVERLRTAIELAPRIDRVEASLADFTGHLRRRAGIETSRMLVVAAGAPHHYDTGAYALRDLRFTNADGTIVDIPAGLIGNYPAEVVKRAVAAGAARALGPRPDFRSVRMLVDVVEEDERGLRRYEAGRLISLPEPIAASFIGRSVAVATDILVDDDIAFWSGQRGFDLPAAGGRSLFSTSRKSIAMPLELGRLEPVTVINEEAA